MRKIFRLAEKTLFFSAEKKMNDHRLPENGLKAGKQIAENTVFSLFGKKRHARMRCPFAKGMHPDLLLLRQPAQDAPFRQAFGKQNSFSTDIPLPPDGARLAYLQ